MADTFTVNLSLTLPEIGASDDTWGDKLNDNFDILDALLNATGTGTLIRRDSSDRGSAGGFAITKAAGNARLLDFLSGTSKRWDVAVTGDAESGSNAGSNFVVRRYSDAASFLGNTIIINRATGEMTLEVTPKVGANVVYHAGNITKSAVGLGNVDNTSDANKPVSAAQQAALDAKAPINSPVFTGNPTAPTPSATDNDTSIATTEYVQAKKPGLLHLRDSKSFGTNGGTFNDGSDRTRTLNTVVTNTIAGSSLTSDRFTLPAGTYEIDAVASAYQVGDNKALLYNVTDAVNVIIGTVCTAVTTAGITVHSFVRGRLTITDAKQFELRHRCSSTKSGNGFGNAMGAYEEVYAEVIIRSVPN